MTEQVKAYMESHGFKYDRIGDLWIAPQDNPWKVYSMNSKQAAFWYRASLIARRDELVDAKMQSNMGQTYYKKRLATLDKLISESEAANDLPSPNTNQTIRKGL